MSGEERRSLLGSGPDPLADNVKCPDAPDTFGLPAACMSIIVVEFCERFAFYGASLCFTMYMMTMLGYDSEWVSAVLNGFNAWCYICAVAGGYLGDAVWGKTRTILAFACVYVVGLLILTASASPFAFNDYPRDPSVFWVYGGFFLSLCLIGMGTGGIKSNVSVMVADQITGQRQIERVFRWFYWSINAGAVLGQFITPILHHYGPKVVDIEGRPQGSSFWASFLAPSVVFVVGIIIFVRGIPKYSTKPIGDSLFTKTIAILRRARANRGLEPKETNFLDRALLVNADPDSILLVRDLKLVAHASKIFIMFPIYWLLYNQMQTTYIEQASLMRSPAWITPDQLNIIDPLCIIIMIPAFDVLIFPGLRRIGLHMGPMVRISIGFMLSSLSMLYASLIQRTIDRDGVFEAGKYHLIIPGSQQISVFMQIPAYLIIAISEIFASVTALELAYSQAPASMKSIVMSMFLVTSAVGSLLGVIVAPMMRISNLQFAFNALAIAMLVFAAIFHGLFRHYISPTMISSSTDNMSSSE